MRNVIFSLKFLPVMYCSEGICRDGGALSEEKRMKSMHLRYIKGAGFAFFGKLFVRAM